jgi:hypothetical protein
MGAAMAVDVVVSRDLKSLQDELSIAQRNEANHNRRPDVRRL